MAHTVTPEEMRRYLRYLDDYVDFPADKATLVAAAERADVPEEVARAIRAIPPVDYHSKEEVLRSVPLELLPDWNAGAEEREHHHRSGVSVKAQALREEEAQAGDAEPGP